MGNLLYVIAVILVILWVIGFLGFHAGEIIHILLVIAAVYRWENYSTDI